LSRLSSSLDRTARWDKELTDDEQQWLVLARISLHKPRWVVIDQVLDALDDDACTRVISLFSDSLKDAAVIHIGRPETKKHFFTRVLHLIKDPYGRCFRPDRTVPSAGQAMGAPSMEWSLSAAGSKVP
jgi:putative ATP-binding cassette transporter